MVEIQKSLLMSAVIGLSGLCRGVWKILYIGKELFNMELMVYNVLRNSVEIRVKYKDEVNNKTYVEVFFAEIVNVEHLRGSNILESVEVNQILELEKYVQRGNSQKFKRKFENGKIPDGLRFYIESIFKS